MNPQNPTQPDQPQPGHPQPVAYDQQGRPLYAHPPAQPQAPQPAQQPQMVYMARPASPEMPEIPPEVAQRHEESVRKYPHLNLSDGEYIISAVKRHPIGLVQIWSFVALMILVFGGVFGVFLLGGGDSGSAFSSFGDQDANTAIGFIVLAVMFALFIGGGFVASYVYEQNHFYLTNESVIQEIQTSPFSKHEQTVSLANIEDASYRQAGIMPHLFNYGLIRLSTEGDETTYRFNYVANPKQHIAVLNNAVESFKNGRPVH